MRRLPLRYLVILATMLVNLAPEAGAGQSLDDFGQDGFSVEIRQSAGSNFKYRSHSQVLGTADFDVDEERVDVGSFGDKISITLLASRTLRIEAIEAFRQSNVLARLEAAMLDVSAPFGQPLFEAHVTVTLVDSTVSVVSKSEFRPVADLPWQLEFYFGVKPDESTWSQRQLDLAELIAHEYFHLFSSAYSLPSKTNSVLDEIFAHLFGRCVQYSISPEFLTFRAAYPPQAFADPEADYPRILAIHRAESLRPTIEGGRLAGYHFQAIANDYDGDFVSDLRIPDFCAAVFADMSARMDRQPHDFLVRLKAKESD